MTCKMFYVLFAVFPGNNAKNNSFKGAYNS